MELETAGREKSDCEAALRRSGFVRDLLCGLRTENLCHIRVQFVCMGFLKRHSYVVTIIYMDFRECCRFHTL